MAGGKEEGDRVGIWIISKKMIYYLHNSNITIIIRYHMSRLTCIGAAQGQDFFATCPLYLSLYFNPVTMVELLGKADLPPNMVSVSGWNRMYSCWMYKFSGSSTVFSASSGSVVSTGVA